MPDDGATDKKVSSKGKTGSKKADGQTSARAPISSRSSKNAPRKTVKKKKAPGLDAVAEDGAPAAVDVTDGAVEEDVNAPQPSYRPLSLPKPEQPWKRPLQLPAPGIAEEKAGDDEAGAPGAPQPAPAAPAAAPSAAEPSDASAAKPAASEPVDVTEPPAA